MTLGKKTAMCKMCLQRELKNSLSNLIASSLICEECLKHLKVTFYERQIDKVPALSIYVYNEYFRSILYQFKAKGDIELATLFLNNYKYYLGLRFYKYVILYAPSNKSSDELRGFNHVREAFKCLGLTEVSYMIKKFDFKQSDLTFDERQKVNEKLELIDGEKLRGKKVLIVDDLITTGATIRAMINLVRVYQPKIIKVLSLSFTQNQSKSDT